MSPEGDAKLNALQAEEKNLAKTGDFKIVPIGEIRENPVALRTVNHQSEKYLGLVSSIREAGFLGAITVRPQRDSETGDVYYELIDGLHRYSAAKDAGITGIPVTIVSLDKDKVLEAQIMMNIHKIDTKPAEYSKQLKRLLNRNHMMTKAELAGKVGMSEQWVSDRLSLNKITDEKINGLIDEGRINLSNAYALSKLPPDEMPNFLDSAMTVGIEEFKPLVDARAKELKEAKKTGLDAKPPEFIPVQHGQKMGAVKDEYKDAKIGTELCKVHKLKTANEGFAMAISWMLHVDPASLKVQKAKYDQRMAEKAEQKKKRDAEKAAKAAAIKKKEDAAAANAAVAAEENVKK